MLDNTRVDIASDAVLARLAEAIALLERYQPWRLAHMRRDVSQLWIARQPFRGAFYPSESTILVELTFLARTDIGPAVVAACLLHEAVHARVHQMRLAPESRHAAREERLCRRAELSFGLSLPGEVGAPVIARAEMALALQDDEVAPEIDQAEALTRQRAVDREALSRWRRGAA